MPEPGKPANVPGIGKVNRKWILAGGAAVAGIILFTYWRNSRLPDEEMPEEGAEYAAGDQWTPDAYIGASAPGGETYDPGDITENVPSTNAEWSQRVIDALESVGYDRNKAATTVGKYLSGQPLDLTEKLIIQTAIAMLGNPPAGALPIISAPTPTTPQPGTPDKLATPVLRYGVGNPRNTIYQLAWNKVPGATHYVVKRELGPGSPAYAVVFGTARKTPSLKRRWTYQYRVQAQAPGKTSSNYSNPVRFKVPAK